MAVARVGVLILPSHAFDAFSGAFNIASRLHIFQFTAAIGWRRIDAYK